MKLVYSLALGLPMLGAGVTHAAELALTLELPQLKVAEYHRPYLAFWLEKPDQGFVANLAVWYDVKKKDNGGSKWLKDMRQWWRKSGRELQMPVDGVSGATRAPGSHKLSFASHPNLQKLAPGEYQLVVEAVREAGGRELLRLPFVWPSKPGGVQNVAVKGREELGDIALQIKP